MYINQLEREKTFFNVIKQKKKKNKILLFYFYFFYKKNDKRKIPFGKKGSLSRRYYTPLHHKRGKGGGIKAAPQEHK